VLRAVCLFAGLGLLTLVLLTLVLALVASLISLVAGLLAALLPFALVGLLAWAACSALARGRRPVWHRLRSGTARVIRWLVAIPVWVCPRLLGWGLGGWRLLAPRVLSLTRSAVGLAARVPGAGFAAVRWIAAVAKGCLVRVWDAAGPVCEVLLETVAGAALGAALIGLTDLEDCSADFGLRLLAGAAAGGLLGLFVGVARSRRTIRAR
jgi:hypothetical protein